MKKSRCSRGYHRHPPKTGRCLKQKRRTRKNKKGGSTGLTKSRIQKIVNQWLNDNGYDEDEKKDFITEKDLEEMTRNAEKNKLKKNEEVYNEIDYFVKGLGKLAD